MNKIASTFREFISRKRNTVNQCINKQDNDNCENGHEESKWCDVRDNKVWGRITLGKVVWERLSEEVTSET